MNNGLFRNMGVPAQSFQTAQPQMPQQKQGLFGMDRRQMLNLIAATGASLASRNPGAFAPTLMQMQQYQQGRKKGKALGSMTSKWLRTQGRNDLADAVDSGQIDGKSAMDFYKTTKAEKPKANYKKAADGYLYDMDTGKRALPDVEKQEVNGISIGPDGQLVVNSKQDEKNRANSILSSQESAKQSTRTMDTITAMRKALDNTGYVGPGGNAYDTVDNLLEGTLGKKYSLPGNPGARAIVKSGGMEFVLDLISKTKGAISEKEMDLFAGASAGLTQTKEGNYTLLDIGEKVVKRTQMRNAEMEKWRQANGTLDGFESAWAQYVTKNPIITDDLFSGAKTPEQKQKTPDLSGMSDAQLEAIANGQ